MSKRVSYKFNRETLQYEVVKTPITRKLFRVLAAALLGFVFFVFYSYLFTGVMGIESPKTTILKRQNAAYHSKLEVLNERYEQKNAILKELQMRDNTVYRPIFGMDSLSLDVRNAGFGGVDRYSFLELYDSSGALASLSAKLDILSKRAYVQVKSLDEVSLLARRSEEMAQCIPSIPPVTTDKNKIRLVSRFGMRTDPFTKKPRFHHGIDLSSPKQGLPIYATGDGVVSKVAHDFMGYGNYIIVDHGFGYKTRYAHLKASLVYEGQLVKKGDHIAELGNTGRSKGPHLHYEVFYKNKTVNPLNYFNPDITPEEYSMMVKPVKATK
ncbi:MAG: M23 family metallopeptidase [Bacteroidales bacterium]|jgi:murein DD-endopeptidase MepM/ murein hydrolase activator NlpD|nr:M23 family metallopeptidase [Bacteroidales bacterium]